jgi:hypothetical protein
MTSFDCESSEAQDCETVFKKIRQPGRTNVDQKREYKPGSLAT